MVHKVKFIIYRRDAKKGCEDKKKCVSWYCFNKRNDGTYEAELDESWIEGSHYGVAPSTGKYLLNGLTFRMMNSLNVSSRWLLRQNMASLSMTLKRRKN